MSPQVGGRLGARLSLEAGLPKVGTCLSRAWADFAKVFTQTRSHTGVRETILVFRKNFLNYFLLLF